MLFWVIDSLSIVYYCNQFSLIYSVLFRGIMSLLSAFLIFLGIGNYLINRLYNLNYFQTIRSCGPKSHLLKKGTPTMGGVLMLFSVIVSVLIWSDLFNKYVNYALFTLIIYGVLGLIDDLYKIKQKDSIGLNALKKYFWQSFIAVILIIYISFFKENDIFLVKKISSFKRLAFRLDFWSILLAYFVLVGSSNAVNLSDGLDGLAIMLIMLIISGLAIIAWLSGDFFYSNYLCIPYIVGIKELVVVSAAIIGAGLGFLWFNSYPAQIFMGDTGSLSFGAVIGLISILLRQEFLLLIMGGLLVVETVSVILQVGYFKLFNKRIFKMTPIHHHFELKGYPEPKIVVRFGIISFILVCLSLVIFLLENRKL